MGIYRREGSPYWQAKVQINKKVHYFSTKERDKQKAQLIFETIKGDIAQRRLLKNIGTSIYKSLENDSESKDWIMKKWNDFNSREKLAILFTLNKGKCSYCKKQVRIGQRVDKKGERATVDHKIPVVGGGSDSFDNLTLACHECNVKKFDQDTYTKRKKVYLTKRRTGKKGYQQQLFKEEQ